MISKRIETQSQVPPSIGAAKAVDSRADNKVKRSQWDELSPSRRRRKSGLRAFNLNCEFPSKKTLKSSHAFANDSHDTVRIQAKTRISNKPCALSKSKTKEFTPRKSKPDYKRLKLRRTRVFAEAHDVRFEQARRPKGP